MAISWSTTRLTFRQAPWFQTDLDQFVSPAKSSGWRPCQRVRDTTPCSAHYGVHRAAATEAGQALVEALALVAASAHLRNSPVLDVFDQQRPPIVGDDFDLDDCGERQHWIADDHRNGVYFVA